MIVLRKLRTFVSLGKQDRLLILQAFCLPVVITAGFRWFGVARTQQGLRTWASRGKARDPDARDWIAIIQKAQRVAGRNGGIKGTCLVRSLALWALLLRRGLLTELRIGMRKREGKIKGHAWLEWCGEPINEAADEISTYEVYRKPVSFDSFILGGK